jgi:hypothetical protein
LTNVIHLLYYKDSKEIRREHKAPKGAFLFPRTLLTNIGRSAVGTTQPNAFKSRFERIQSTRSVRDVQIIEAPKNQLTIKLEKIGIHVDSDLLRPSSPSWEQVVAAVSPLINAPGYTEKRIKELYDEGYGAELISAAENSTIRGHNPMFHFMKCTSRKSGNWEKRTLGFVRRAWKARTCLLEVMTKLNINPKFAKYILKRAWALGDRMLVHLGAALEKGAGIKSSLKLFMWLISPKRQTTVLAAST